MDDDNLSKGKTKVKNENRSMVKTMENDRYINAEKNLKIGECELLNSNFEEAIVYFKNGISGLGRYYFYGEFLDDSGYGIAYAMSKEREKDYGAAARLLRDALSSRLGIYQAKIKAGKDTC